MPLKMNWKDQCLFLCGHNIYKVYNDNKMKLLCINIILNLNSGKFNGTTNWSWSCILSNNCGTLHAALLLFFNLQYRLTINAWEKLAVALRTNINNFAQIRFRPGKLAISNYIRGYVPPLCINLLNWYKKLCSSNYIISRYVFAASCLNNYCLFKN